MNNTEQERDKAETARYIRSAWEALTAPDCTKDDLIDLGKSVYAKVKLRSLDDALFGRLLPYLTTVANTLGNLVLHRPASTPLSKEETAFFIRAVWEALLSPLWLRNDLIDLGKAVHAKTPLAELDARLFERLLPHLTLVAQVLQRLVAQNAATFQAPPATPPAKPQIPDSDLTPGAAAQSNRPAEEKAP
jgi:hypothetical protein